MQYTVTAKKRANKLEEIFKLMIYIKMSSLKTIFRSLQ